MRDIERTARYLLNSFVKALKTSSKTEGKFVVLIVLNNELYLIHSGTDIPGLYEPGESQNELHRAFLWLLNGNMRQ